MKSRLARAGVVGAMAAGAVVAVTSVGAPGGAQTDASTIIEHPGLDQAPAISDDGRIIVFATAPDASGEGSSLVIHDRGPVDADGNVSAATTTAISDSIGAVNPTISGNGCVITWSVPATDPENTDPVDPDPPAEDPPEQAPPATDNEVESATLVEPEDAEDPEPVVESVALQTAPARLVALDRCSDGVRADLPLGADDLVLGPAGASVDGSVIAVSSGTEVIRFARIGADQYGETNRFDGDDAESTGDLVGDRVDVSDDGSVVVFSSGADPTDTSTMTVFAHVVEGSGAATTPVLAAATDASVSGDGTLVVVSTGPDGSAVALIERTVSPIAPIDLGPGRRPVISADGNHVVVEEGANLAVISSTGQGDAPFATIQRTLLSTTITPTGSGPAIDRFGATVVSDRAIDVDAAPTDTDITVTTVGADASFDAELFDLGSGDIGDTLETTVTFSNRGPSSIGVASLVADGEFSISEDRCGPVVRPGTTCEIDVTFVVERLEDAFASITLTPTSFGIPALSTEVTALGEAPEVSTTSTTSTTAPPSTGSTTGGTTTGGTTTGTTRTTTATTTTTTTTVAPGTGVLAVPAAFDFAPTIIDDGRRTGLVEIVNDGSAPATIVGVRVDPPAAGPFQIVETTCAGATLAVGASCEITVSFAPIETGATSVSLVASIEGGSDLIVPVTGTGAPAPTITVIPGVASLGQVVTIAGAGFPTGIAIDVVWLSTVTEVEVGDDGTFALPVVVMSHTPTGPATMLVTGQTDLFGDITGSLLVTDTSTRSGPPVIDGVGVDIGR